MSAGKMRDWVKFFKPTDTVSPSGSNETTFFLEYETWCNFTALGGGESVQSAAVRGTTDAQIFYRTLNAPDATSKWRIDLNGKLWQVLAVFPIANDKSMSRAVIRYGSSIV